MSRSDLCVASRTILWLAKYTNRDSHMASAHEIAEYGVVMAAALLLFARAVVHYDITVTGCLPDISSEDSLPKYLTIIAACVATVTAVLTFLPLASHERRPDSVLFLIALGVTVGVAAITVNTDIMRHDAVVAAASVTVVALMIATGRILWVARGSTRTPRKDQ